MKIPFLSISKYRVLEVKKGNNTSLFYPQERYQLFRWRNMTDPDFTSTDSVFNAMQAANEFLYTAHRADLAKTTVGKKAHGFDAVFHKLKQTEVTGDNPTDGGFV